MRHMHLVVGHDRHFVIVHLHAVCDAHIVAEHTEFFEVHHRPVTELGDEPLRVELRWRHVKAHAHTLFGRKLACCLPQRIGAGRVPDENRPCPDAIVGGRPVPIELPLKRGDRLVGVLFVDIGFGWQVPHPGPDSTANAHLGESVDDGVEEPDGAGFKECRRARLQHLDRCHLRGQPLLFFAVRGVQRTEPHEDVLFERGVVGDVPSRQRLTRDVDVGVDQPGGDNEVVAANHLTGRVPSLKVRRLPDVDDLRSTNCHRALVNDVALLVHRDDVPTLDEQIDRFHRFLFQSWGGLRATNVC